MRRVARRCSSTARGAVILTTRSKLISNSASKVCNACACGMVRGKPSNKNPWSQSGNASRRAIIARINSSETNWPRSITAAARRPNSSPVSIACRSISPLEIGTEPSTAANFFASVPLPTPGAPNKINFIVLFGV